MTRLVKLFAIAINLSFILLSTHSNTVPNILALCIIFVITVEDILNNDIQESLQRCRQGYITFFSLKQENFYFIYRRKSLKCLTPNWRRGAPIKSFKKLSFLKKSKNKDIRKIRREDFKQIFKKLEEVQKKGNEWFSIQIISNKITCLNLGQEQFSFETFTIKGYEKLKKLSGGFLKQIQNDILHKRHIHKTIQKYGRLFRGSESDLESFMTTSNKYIKIILTGESYKVLASIMKIFLRKQIVAAGLPQVSTETRKTYSKKIRRVLVLTNCSGESLKYLHQKKEFWDEGFSNYAWKHIYGNFSKKRILALIEDGRIFEQNDLIIYRGHALIKNKNIHWVLEDGDIALKPDLMAARYIHLSCLHFKSIQDDIESLPFREAVLPLSYFKDRDESLFMHDFFGFLERGNSFQDACFKALQKNKESQMFSYWFS